MRQIVHSIGGRVGRGSRIAWLAMAGAAAASTGCGTGGQQATAPDAGPARPANLVIPTPAEVEQAAAKSSAATGRPAPDFALPDHEGRTVRLADHRGKWVVLYIYPQDDTPGCTCQATEFTQLLGEFRDMNAEVLGVSRDSPADHRYFRQKYDLTLTLLSDEGGETMRRYGAWVETPAAGEGTGRTIRQTYLIDPQGKIARHWPEVIPEGHAERVKQALAERAKSPATRPTAAAAAAGSAAP